ncbi:MAG: hypothetical protein ACOYOL_07510 [Chthoniobacterales bacterium]
MDAALQFAGGEKTLGGRHGFLLGAIPSFGVLKVGGFVSDSLHAFIVQKNRG